MTNIHSSQLYDNATFYDAFTKDILKSQHSLIIESPFITLKRLEKQHMTKHSITPPIEQRLCSSTHKRRLCKTLRVRVFGV